MKFGNLGTILIKFIEITSTRLMASAFLLKRRSVDSKRNNLYLRILTQYPL